MLFGIINVNKPKGLTSNQVVTKLRKILCIKQIGHTGTLDPLAVGVLPVCVGKATKIIQYLDTSKAYRAYVLLGVRTDSYDLEGEVISKEKVTPDEAKIKILLEDFRGEIVQTPPIYSAVHYKGKRLYEYARKGIEVPDIPTRKVVIYDINLVEIKENVAVIDIDCSGGTYIRSIAHELGEKLGYGACLENLTRTRSGNLKLEDSLTLEEIENGCIDKFLLPVQAFLNFEIIEINYEQAEELRNGRYFKVDKTDDSMAQLVYKGKLAAIAKCEGNKVMPVKVFLDIQKNTI